MALFGKRAHHERTGTTIVLVHGGFVDGSGWEGVYGILKKDGYDVSIVQNPTTSLADDVAATKRVIAARTGRRSWSATPMAAWWSLKPAPIPRWRARLHRRLRAGQGRVGLGLIQNPPPGAPVPPILPPQDGFLFLDKAKFAASFAADVDAEKAAFMADSQVPWGVGGAGGRGQRAGMEDQAELVPGRDRGQDDPAAGAARDVQAGRATVSRGAGKPRGLRLSAASRGSLIEKAAASLAE